MIDTVGFDGDDTLWHSERYFVDIEARLPELLAGYVSTDGLAERLVATERSATIVLWFSLTASVAGLLTLPFGWISLSQPQVLALIGAGICGGVGQILMTESYRHAEMSTVAPFEYTSMVLGIASGYLFFGDLPGAQLHQNVFDLCILGR